MAASVKLLNWPFSGFRIWPWFTGIADVVNVWRRRARDRDALHRLNDHYLQDIGLTRRDVMVEYAKPFWRE